MICETCKKEVKSFKHYCDGDYKVHGHGAVHTFLRGNINDLAYIGIECGCAEKDKIAWNEKRGLRC